MEQKNLELSTDQVTSQLRALGIVPGDVVLVHASFRALRPVENGARGLIDALLHALGLPGTLVMPSWSDQDNTPFDPAASAAAKDLGVVADLFWRMPGVLRSAHSFAFAARGPQAGHITSDALPIPPHIPESPVGRVHELDGKVLLLGVDHRANTTLHLAEVFAGVPYGVPKNITVSRAGRPILITYAENDHCCERFALADHWLRERGLQSEGLVGHAHARLARARHIVDVALPRLRQDPLLFLHALGSGCGECDDAHRSIAGWQQPA
ncbi:MAG: AAC(3) family N-acetyltransferase [Longimicrobiales bacterium]